MLSAGARVFSARERERASIERVISACFKLRCGAEEIVFMMQIYNKNQKYRNVIGIEFDC